MIRCWLIVLSIALAAPAMAASRSVKPADMIKAAKAASVGEIDDRKKSCDDSRSVEVWLKETLGDSARAIRWTAGRCRLVNKNNPLDAGTRWCAQAEITPRTGGPPAVIEVYFDEPKDGKPGKAFAFRASVHTKQGWDYMRETSAFEINWGETYIPGYKPPQDCP